MAESISLQIIQIIIPYKALESLKLLFSAKHFSNNLLKKKNKNHCFILRSLHCFILKEEWNNKLYRRLRVSYQCGNLYKFKYDLYKFERGMYFLSWHEASFYRYMRKKTWQILVFRVLLASIDVTRILLE